MEAEQAKIHKMGDVVQWWTNDQTFFNEVIHRRPHLHTAAQVVEGAERAAAEQEIRMHLRHRDRIAQLNRTSSWIESALAEPAAELAALRGLVFKRVPCMGLRQRPGCLGRPLSHGRLRSLHSPIYSSRAVTPSSRSRCSSAWALRPSPYTTFQFGDTPEFTWGKRNRLRERHLWLVEDDAYYRRDGATLEATEASRAVRRPTWATST